jgi:hypothetical protein
MDSVTARLLNYCTPSKLKDLLSVYAVGKPGILLLVNWFDGSGPQHQEWEGTGAIKLSLLYTSAICDVLFSAGLLDTVGRAKLESTSKLLLQTNIGVMSMFPLYHIPDANTKKQKGILFLQACSIVYLAVKCPKVVVNLSNDGRCAGFDNSIDHAKWVAANSLILGEMYQLSEYWTSPDELTSAVSLCTVGGFIRQDLSDWLRDRTTHLMNYNFQPPKTQRLKEFKLRRDYIDHPLAMLPTLLGLCLCMSMK